MPGKQPRRSNQSGGKAQGRGRTKRGEKGRLAPADRPRTGGRRGSTSSKRKGTSTTARGSGPRRSPGDGWTWNDEPGNTREREEPEGLAGGYRHDERTPGMQDVASHRGPREAGGSDSEDRRGGGEATAGQSRPYRAYELRGDYDERWYDEAQNDDRERAAATEDAEPPASHRRSPKPRL
jgi:hypothetical protein